MGSGHLRNIKMNRYATQVRDMSKQLERMTTDPEGAFQQMAKPLITQLQEANYTKNKLSALVCALLENSGGSIAIKRAKIDQFQQHRLTINSESNPEDDGTSPDVDITFTFTAVKVEQPPIDSPPMNDAPIGVPIQ